MELLDKIRGLQKRLEEFGFGGEGEPVSSSS